MPNANFLGQDYINFRGVGNTSLYLTYLLFNELMWYTALKLLRIHVHIYRASYNYSRRTRDLYWFGING